MRIRSVMFMSLVGCLLLGLVSCSDDNEGIVGTWHRYFPLYSADGERLKKDLELIVEFHADGTLTSELLREGELITSTRSSYTLSGETFRIESALFGVNSGTWTRTGNTLTLTNGEVLVLKKR